MNRFPPIADQDCQNRLPCSPFRPRAGNRALTFAR
jgi:hypothetical protein